MLQVVLHKFPQTHSVYHFRCRNLEDTVYPLTDILNDLNQQLDYLCDCVFRTMSCNIYAIYVLSKVTLLII
jgi:nicotinate phosphoribosyltransferase